MLNRVHSIHSSARWSGAAAVLVYVCLSSTIKLAAAPQNVSDQTAETVADGWAYKPVNRPAVPSVADEAWVANPIDAFILARLEAKHLQPAPAANKIALLRRATYDLTGLPPTLPHIEAFLADDSEDAYQKLIDRLLASPQYGVKWGRHWLDLVRYAETDSFERDRRKPAAWRYRDYVIDSFNADKPYDRFVSEQLAGDELDRPTFETIVATGYYRLGIWDDEPTDTLQAQYDDLDGILDTTSRVMLGISMGCARCHDHKGDPLPQRDYYRMLAFFRGIKPYKVGGGNNVTRENFVKSVPLDLGSDDFERRVQKYVERRESLTARLTAIRKATIDRLTSQEQDALPTAPPEGLVRHWPFDQSMAKDIVGKTQAEVHGDPVTQAGRTGSAIQFDGKDDYIRIERPVTDDFTISFWLRTTATGPGGSDYRWFLGAGLVDGEIPGIVPDFGVSYHSDGRIAAGTGAPETFIISPPGNNDGKWHHVAFVREMSSGRIALYVDGEEVASATGSKKPLGAPAHLDIGRMMPGNSYFEGALDDLRIYSRAVRPREVMNLYFRGGLDRAFVAEVRRVEGDAQAARYETAISELLKLKRPVRPTEQVLCVMENGPEAPPTHLLERGNAHAPAEEVRPGFPSMLGFDDPTITVRTANAASSGRRRALAEWIVSPSNPLTARVMANRLWQYHFGRGIVSTSNDFGVFGQKPTHPELLDWLAAEFVHRGWSMKEMHKLIMTSSAYRMSSRADAAALRADPTNAMYWRFDMRRLTAEEVRDSILAVSGELNLKMGGPSVYPEMPPEVLATSSRPGAAWGRSPPEEAARRSVYIHVKRSLLPPMLTSFDMADTDASCAVRFVTTQATQALTLLNSDFINQRAAVFAKRLRREAEGDVAQQIELALRLTRARATSADDIRRGAELINWLQHEGGKDSDEALKYFCLMVLNLNEFIYLD